MKLTPLTIGIFIVSLFAIAWLIAKLRRDNVSIRFACTWIVMWVFIGIGVTVPSILDNFMEIAQFSQRFYFGTTSAIFLLFAVVFHLTYRLEQSERKVAQTIQALAIADYRVRKLEDRLAERLPGT